MDIIEAARQLGAAIQADERFKKLVARNPYSCNRRI